MKRTIELAYSSLVTHLDQANKPFHAQAIREYAEIIFAGATELEALANETS